MATGTILNMTPDFTLKDFSYRFMSDTILSADSSYRQIAFLVQSPDFINIVIGKFSPSSRLPSWYFSMRGISKRLVSSFIPHIFSIFLRRAEEQVFRIHATWIVAFVQHPFIAWWKSITKLPGNSRGRSRFSVSLNFPVARRGLIRSPIPTIFRFFNFSPKPFFDRYFMTSHAVAIIPMIKLTRKRG